MSEDSFDGSPISRRQFVRPSAATGGVLALPGAASADVSSPSFDAAYQYLLHHTPDDYEIPTLVEFGDAASTGGDVVVGIEELDDERGHVVGSLLPPANQSNLHPFGMVDHAATYFGHLVMTNALFGQQVREVDGEETLRIGRGSE